MDRAKLRKILWWLAAVLAVGLLMFAVFGKKPQKPADPGSSATASSSETLTQGIFETETLTQEPASSGSETADSREASETEEAGETKAPSSEDRTSEAETEASSEKAEASSEPETTTEPGLTVSEDGEYSDKDHVALYIHTYNKLPSNYITKKEAENLGWVSRKGNLWKVAYGKSIGGSTFGNYEGMLPKAKGRKYYECDIDFDGTYRNEKRIVYSNDGLIFYTDDHYETFEQLY